MLSRSLEASLCLSLIVFCCRLPQVAVRSEEPYRLQCYTFLTAVASSDYLGVPAHPTFNCVPAGRTLPALDRHCQCSAGHTLSLATQPIVINHDLASQSGVHQGRNVNCWLPRWSKQPNSVAAHDHQLNKTTRCDRASITCAACAANLGRAVLHSRRAGENGPAAWGAAGQVAAGCCEAAATAAQPARQPHRAPHLQPGQC